MNEYMSRIHTGNCKIVYLLDTLKYTVGCRHNPRYWRQNNEDTTHTLKNTSTQTTENLRGLVEDTMYTESKGKTHPPTGAREGVTEEEVPERGLERWLEVYFRIILQSESSCRLEGMGNYGLSRDLAAFEP